MTKREKLIDFINGMGVEEKIALHNTYCDAANCMDGCIYAMDELEDISDYILSKEDSLGNDEIQEILDDEEELRELAAKIHAAKTWVEVEDELRALCDAAGMADEYKAADGDNFEAVIYKAAERLGVEV